MKLFACLCLLIVIITAAVGSSTKTHFTLNDFKNPLKISLNTALQDIQNILTQSTNQQKIDSTFSSAITKTRDKFIYGNTAYQKIAQPKLTPNDYILYSAYARGANSQVFNAAKSALQQELINFNK